MIGWIAPRNKMVVCDSHRVASRSPSMLRGNAGNFRLQTYKLPLAASLCLGLLLSSIGCQSWSPGSQIKQCQMESDRLLAEFRAQKKRADELEGKYQESQSRLAEAEKLLARVQNGSGRSGGVLADRSNLPSRSSTSNVSGPASTLLNAPGGLPSRSTANSDSNIQWRPQGAPLR